MQGSEGTGAVLIVLQRLYVWHASQSENPSNILHIPSNILLTPTPPIFYVPPKKFCVPCLIFYVPLPKFCAPHLIFDVPPPGPIFYENLTCDAMDTRSARPLPQGVVNCGVERPFLVTSCTGT